MYSQINWRIVISIFLATDILSKRNREEKNDNKNISQKAINCAKVVSKQKFQDGG